MPEPHVEVVGISKRFGGVQALADVSVTIERGEIHGLVGENGAGKSTLGKIIAGAFTPDEGELRVAGRTVSYRAPRDALADGLTLIAQEISLVPARSVIENVYLGREASTLGWVDRRELRRRFAELNGRAGFDLPADAPAGTLRLADQQKVEILRALARGAELIVMDEPSAALTADERRTAVRDRPRPQEAGHDDRVRLSFPRRGALPGRHGHRAQGRRARADVLRPPSRRPIGSSPRCWDARSSWHSPRRRSRRRRAGRALGAGARPRRRHPRRLARGPRRRDRRARRADRVGALGGGAGNLRRGSTRCGRRRARRSPPDGTDAPAGDPGRRRDAARVSQGPGPAHGALARRERHPAAPRGRQQGPLHQHAQRAAPRREADARRRRPGRAAYRPRRDAVGRQPTEGPVREVAVPSPETPHRGRAHPGRRRRREAGDLPAHPVPRRRRDGGAAHLQRARGGARPRASRSRHARRAASSRSSTGARRHGGSRCWTPRSRPRRSREHARDSLPGADRPRCASFAPPRRCATTGSCSPSSSSSSTLVVRERRVPEAAELA